ncbi:hypothetical protein, partial [Bacillus subtilis]|uniref:hypothetical protein n=1 Tax=Bacillus subtilis TaxID=1423 RepID=UPI002281A893
LMGFLMMKCHQGMRRLRFEGYQLIDLENKVNKIVRIRILLAVIGRLLQGERFGKAAVYFASVLLQFNLS